MSKWEIQQSVYFKGYGEKSQGPEHNCYINLACQKPLETLVLALLTTQRTLALWLVLICLNCPRHLAVHKLLSCSLNGSIAPYGPLCELYPGIRRDRVAEVIECWVQLFVKTATNPAVWGMLKLRTFFRNKQNLKRKEIFRPSSF